jgi:hypothetical protein
MGLVSANREASWRTWCGTSGGVEVDIPYLTALQAVRTSSNIGPFRNPNSGDMHPGAVLFLTSDDAAIVTEQAIVVDGGQYRIG